MKKFCISSILLMLCVQAMACYAPVIHDYYLFSVYHHDMVEPQFSELCDKNWAAYTNGAVTYYDHDALIKYANGKGDKQMVAYLQLLSQYQDCCITKTDPWDYPSKEQLTATDTRLRSIRTQAQAALRSRLRSQNALLVMRCNIMLGQHQANAAFWNQWGGQLPNSVYRDMMRNIYAGALCHLGKKDEACEIFAEQGDITSIRYCMYNDLSYDGIRRVYNQNPDSPALFWLVQNYVNDAQSTLCAAQEDADSPFEQVPLLPAYRNDIANFIAMANRAATDGHSSVPTLWKTAAAWMEFMYGDHQQAQTYIDQAVALDGTIRMRDNARAIRFYITAANTQKYSKSFDDYVLQELRWLRQKHEEDCLDDNCWPTTTHYSRVIDRVIFEVLADKYDSWGLSEIATALYAMADTDWDYDDSTFNSHYRTYLFQRLDTMAPEHAIRFLNLVKEPTPGLASYLVDNIYHDTDFLNDIIGTRYMAQADWQNAIDYLRRVPLTFLDKQNICEYMSTRSYTIEPWRKSQLKEMRDAAGIVHLSTNMKIEFAREMSQLESQLAHAKEKARCQLAYDYAVRIYQASYKGDCWFLTHYGKSVADTARADEPDFVAIAARHLRQASGSNDFLLREKALYALAYIPLDPWYEEQYDPAANDFVKRPRPQSNQYQAMSDLLMLYEHQPMSDYASKCDVLKAFRQSIARQQH